MQFYICLQVIFQFTLNMWNHVDITTWLLLSKVDTRSFQYGYGMDVFHLIKADEQYKGVIRCSSAQCCV